MDTVVLILAGIFVVNLFIAGWLVTLGLMDRYQHHKATREVDALERSLAMPSAGRDVLSARRFGGTHLALDIRELRESTHRGIAGRRSPVLPRLFGKASIGVALASIVLWVAVVAPDLGGQPTTTSVEGGGSLSFQPTWRSPLDRAAPTHVGVVPALRAGSSTRAGVSPESLTVPPPSTNTTTNTNLEGESVPRSVAAQSRSSTAISLAWATVAGALGYTIERRSEETHDVGWVKVATVDSAATTYTDVGLAAATTYFYRIAAVTEEGPAPPSDVISATTPIAPPAATHLIATRVGTTVALAWVDVSQETAYRIERSHHGTNDWITIGTTGEDVTAYTDASLTPGDTYRYRIVATNAGGDSDPSNVVPVKIETGEATAPPDDPSTAPGTGVVLEPKDDRPAGKNSTEESPVSEDSPVTEVDQ